MGVILDLLTAEHFRKRPMMYVGSRDFIHVGYWLQGMEYCYRELHPTEPGELDGFKEWLQMKFDGPGNTNWQGIISSVFGEDENATDKAFEYLDEFLLHLKEVGLDQIIDDHEKYEMNRYGAITSSRLRKQ
jgi:hypothetical protein